MNAFSCIRDDGTSIWMQANLFMIAHDLAHYAVEKTLPLKFGFYGLLESGLHITDFEKNR